MNRWWAEATTMQRLIQPDDVPILMGMGYALMQTSRLTTNSNMQQRHGEAPYTGAQGKRGWKSRGARAKAAKERREQAQKGLGQKDNPHTVKKTSEHQGDLRHGFQKLKTALRKSPLARELKELKKMAVPQLQNRLRNQKRLPKEN